MIEREVFIQEIARNLVQAVMLESALTHDIPLARISFKGALTAMGQRAPHLHDTSGERCARLCEDKFVVVASELLPVRDQPRRTSRRQAKA